MRWTVLIALASLGLATLVGVADRISLPIASAQSIANTPPIRICDQFVRGQVLVAFRLGTPESEQQAAHEAAGAVPDGSPPVFQSDWFFVVVRVEPGREEIAGAIYEARSSVRHTSLNAIGYLTNVSSLTFGQVSSLGARLIVRYCPETRIPGKQGGLVVQNESYDDGVQYMTVMAEEQMVLIIAPTGFTVTILEVQGTPFTTCRHLEWQPNILHCFGRLISDESGDTFMRVTIDPPATAAPPRP